MTPTAPHTKAHLKDRLFSVSPVQSEQVHALSRLPVRAVGPRGPRARLASLGLTHWCVWPWNRPPAPPAGTASAKAPEWPWAAGVAPVPVTAVGVWGVSGPGSEVGLWGLQTWEAMCLLWKVGLRAEPRPCAPRPSSMDRDWQGAGYGRVSSVLGAEALASASLRQGLKCGNQDVQRGPGGRCGNRGLLPWREGPTSKSPVPVVPQPPPGSRGLLTGSQASPMCRACSGTQSQSHPH